MKNIKKITKLAFLTIVIGIVFIIIGISGNGIDYIKNNNINSFKTISYDKNSSYLIKYTENLEYFSNIEANLNRCDFEIKLSSNDSSYVEYYSNKKDDFEVLIENNTLKISQNSDYIFGKKDYHIGIDINLIKDFIFKERSNNNLVSSGFKFTIYLPKDKIEKIDVVNQFGNVNIQDITANNLSVTLNMGDLNIENDKLAYVNIKNNKGDINLKKVVVENKITVENDMGDIELKDCSLHTCKAIQHMGAIEFERLDVESKIEMENSMGSISGDIIVDRFKNYNVDANADMGSVSIDDIFKTRVTSENIVDIKLKTNMGSIELNKN